MVKKFKIHYDCGTVKITLTGSPKVHAYCHCIDCRELVKTPFSALTAWEEEYAEITYGEESLKEFGHPEKQMKRLFCSMCGETLFYTNSLGWRIVSQLLIEKFRGLLPDEFISNKHTFYEQRIIDIDDNLPKYLRGSSSPLYNAND